MNFIEISTWYSVPVIRNSASIASETKQSVVSSETIFSKVMSLLPLKMRLLANMIRKIAGANQGLGFEMAKNLLLSSGNCHVIGRKTNRS